MITLKQGEAFLLQKCFCKATSSLNIEERQQQLNLNVFVTHICTSFFTVEKLCGKLYISCNN